MDNSYFLFTDKGQNVRIERFHICTWEFKNNSSLIEFGCEINNDCLINKNSVQINLYIPWFMDGCRADDFYTKLSDSNNSRFIFNDSINNIISFDGGRNLKGVVYQFSERDELCILPVAIQPDYKGHKITLNIDLVKYSNFIEQNNNKPNIYFRISIKPNVSVISTIKYGINRSTILYDIKVNEKRNVPISLINEMENYEYCDIKACFCFNIIPNSYDLVFLDNSTLQSVRTLEYESFKSYLSDRRVKKDELIVVFNKKKKGVPLSFFTIYSKERIGAGQLIIALVINFICGIFLFIPAYRKTFNPEMKLINVWNNLPAEIYIGLAIIFVTLFVFMRYYFVYLFVRVRDWTLLKLNKN